MAQFFLVSECVQARARIREMPERVRSCHHPTRGSVIVPPAPVGLCTEDVWQRREFQYLRSAPEENVFSLRHNGVVRNGLDFHVELKKSSTHLLEPVAGLLV